MRLWLVGLGLSVLLTGCGYDGHVRYPCQEYKNWKNPECQPPKCLPTGTCTKDLVKQSYNG